MGKHIQTRIRSKPTFLAAFYSWSNLEIGHIFCNSKLVKIFKQEPLHNPHFYQILIHETYEYCGIILQPPGEGVYLQWGEGGGSQSYSTSQALAKRKQWSERHGSVII